MARIFISMIVGAAVAGFAALAILRARRRRKSRIPEINQHPERLEQMLDETDDA